MPRIKPQPGIMDIELYVGGSSSVEGVSDVVLAGVPEEVIYVEPDPALTVTTGIPPAAILGAVLFGVQPPELPLPK